MRIAMIGQKGVPAISGGVERHVDELSKRLAARGFDVVIYARKWYTQAEGMSLQRFTVKNMPSIHTKHLDTITHVLLSTLHAITHRVDVIHYHGVGPALLSWIPRIFTPHIRVVSTFHSIDRKHRKWGFVARLLLKFGEFAACRFAHQTIAVSHTIKQYARDVYDCDALYIPNAVPLYTKRTSTNALAQFGLSSNGYVLMVSRLIAHKGAHYAIAAWKKLLSESPKVVQDKKLVIVGDGYQTDAYVAALKMQAAHVPSIVFTGTQSGESLAELYTHAACMIHPSENEGMPFVVLEAMSYSLPVLVSDIPEHKDLIADTAFRFRVRDTQSLKERLNFVLTAEKETRKKQGEKNRAIIASSYQWDKVVSHIVEVYTDRPQSLAVIPSVAVMP